MLILLAFVGLILILIYKFLAWNYDYWLKRGVPYAKPRLFVGSFPHLINQKQHFVNDIDDIYRKFKESENYVGVYLMRTPMLLVLDPKMVHDILVTNFKSFHDNDAAKLLDVRKDPLISRNPFLLIGQEWREQRALVSPGLTGTRVKVAYSIMQRVCHGFCGYIEQESKMASKKGLNAKDLALRFTCENVMDSVLGIKAQSFTPNPLPVSENVRSFTENNTIFLIYIIMTGIFPKILKVFKAKFIPQKTESFFLNLMEKAFQMRLESKLDRQDFLNHLLSLKQKKEINDVDLASHSMTFLIDGLDTTATVIAHCLLLLARDAEVQERLFEEISGNLDENGELSFEKLNELPYLDACLHESIRIFPPGLFATKSCTEPFELTNKDGKKLTLNVGDAILLPFYSLAQDAAYLEDPEKYDPERFMPENGGTKKYRDLGVFLPLVLERAWVGVRFALVQSKACISAVIKNFKVKVNPKTKPKNRLSPKAFLALQDGGAWLDFEKRV